MQTVCREAKPQSPATPPNGGAGAVNGPSCIPEKDWQEHGECEISLMDSMSIGQELQSKRVDILRLADRHGASEVRVFGSVARGEAGADSDVDLLIKMAPERSLLDHVALWQDLEDLLGRKVDLVSEKALHRLIRDQILKEAVPL